MSYQMFHVKLVFVAVIAVLAIANANAKPNVIESRIKNGKYAERGQFPFYVYLEAQSSLLTVIFQANSTFPSQNSNAHVFASFSDEIPKKLWRIINFE